MEFGMIFTPAFAQGAGAAAGPSLIETMLPFVLIFVIMYFLIIRPQQKKAKEHRQMLDALRRGDEVITAGGIYAKITKVKDTEDEVEAEIAQGVKVRLVKSLISTVASKTEPAADKK